MLLMLASAIVLLVNGMTIGSPIIGIGGSMAYLILGGYLIKGIFGGKCTVVDLFLGVLLLVVLVGLIGWLFTISYKLGVVEVFITLCLALFFTSLVQKFTPHPDFMAKVKHNNTSLFVRFVEANFIALICLQVILLFQSRTPMPISIWNTMNPWVMVMFFFNTILLVILMFTDEKWQIKMLLIVVQSIFAHMFFVLLFDAGYGQDQWVTLGWTRRLFDESFYPQGVTFHIHSPLPILYKISKFVTVAFQPALSTMLSRMFSVDVYWGHLLLVPLMWGIFVPVIAYRITVILTRKRVLALLSALLTLAAPKLILWGAVSVANSLGYILFFFTICIVLDYLSSDRTVLWAVLISFVTLLAHLLPGIMAFSFVFFAYTFKRCQNIEFQNMRKIILLCSFFFCLGLLPLALYSGRLAYPALTGADFTIKPLEGLSTYDAIALFLFGAYVDVTFDEAVVHVLLPLSGLLGLLYINIAGNKFVHNKGLSRFFLLSFILVMLDYRIVKCFMVNVPFGTERIWVLRDMLSIPFASIFIYKLVAILSNLIPKRITVRKRELKDFANRIFRSITIKAIPVLCLSSLIISSVYLGYPHRSYVWLTSREVEAARFIDSSTNEPYVVVCSKAFRLAGYAVVGANNPVAYYSYLYDHGWLEGLFNKASQGSASAMIEAAKVNNASIAFFVISNFRSKDADSVIDLLSERPDFEPYEIFGDDVYIFRYIVHRERFVEGVGPIVYIYSHEEYVNTTFVADLVTFEAKYTIVLTGSDNYVVTKWPSHWSFEEITPEPTARFIDGNLWINITGKEDVEYRVSWTANLLYREVGWKDDGFITGWSIENTAGFAESPIIQNDGDVLTITGNFQSGVREFYWIRKRVNVSTDLYSHILVRWRSTSTCAIAWVRYVEGPPGTPLLLYGSYSADWTTTVVRLPKRKTITYIMVGLDDYTTDIGGVRSADFDFVMLTNYTGCPEY